LDANDPAVGEMLVCRLPPEYQRVIERLILHPDKRITSDKPGNYGTRSNMCCRLEIEQLRVTLPDGQTLMSKAMLFDRTVSASGISNLRNAK